MDINKALKVLSLDDEFTQMELISAYKQKVKENDPEASDANESMSYSKTANQLYDISNAYLSLREKELIFRSEMNIQPIIIFTDASLKKNIDVATFAIVTNNIPKDFRVPNIIIRKYNIQAHHDENQSMCKLTGLVANYNPHAAEIMGILSALEIFSYLAKETNQKIVFYTDSLIAKKVLSDKRMPPNSKLYINFRKYFNKMVNQHSLVVKIKKVAAHQGIELNELADSLAKQRLKSI